MIEPSDLPQSTIVVVPKPLPMNRSAFWMLFWTIGVLMGLFARDVIGTVGGETWAAPTQTDSDAGSSPRSFGPAAPVVVRAVLELPSPTPTPTAPPTRTAEARGFDICTLTPAPGTRCKVPQPTPLPPTPLASCAQMATLTPGDWCVWPREDER